MKVYKEEGYGIQALKVTISINDAVAIANLLGKLNEYESKLAAHNAWEENLDNETGKLLPEPENPNAEGAWNPQDFIVKARIFLEKLAFVKNCGSDIFEEERSVQKTYSK
jgi:hypothetical protein